MSDTIHIRKQRTSDQIKASDERCIACQELLRQATDLVAMSRDAIARSREKVELLLARDQRQNPPTMYA